MLFALSIGMLLFHFAPFAPEKMLCKVLQNVNLNLKKTYFRQLWGKILPLVFAAFLLKL